MEEKRYMEVINDMNLLSLGDSAGVVYWKPAGFKIYSKLQNFIREKHIKHGYMEVKSPSLVVNDLFKQSGHLDKYIENIFSIHSNRDEESSYLMRPMSCPNHILLYQSDLKSYRDLPFNLFEFGEVFRNEPSGSLQVLFRQRQFCQDDSHVFVHEESLVDSINRYISMAQESYKDLGFESIKYVISLRPQERFGDDSDWDRAEEALRNACRMNHIEFEEAPGEGAFYGPKIELKVQDKLNRWWQLGTLQLDYVLPKRFDMEYVAADGSRQVPIILHHAVLGSLERMVGILLESFGKNIPDFLHPYRDVVISVSEKFDDYAKLLSQNISQSIFDSSNDKIGKKIQKWKSMGAQNIYVVGEKESLAYKNEGIFKANLNKFDGSREDVIIEKN